MKYKYQFDHFIINIEIKYKMIYHIVNILNNNITYNVNNNITYNVNINITYNLNNNIHKI